MSRTPAHRRQGEDKVGRPAVSRRRSCFGPRTSTEPQTLPSGLNWSCTLEESLLKSAASPYWEKLPREAVEKAIGRRMAKEPYWEKRLSEIRESLLQEQVIEDSNNPLHGGS